MKTRQFGVGRSNALADGRNDVESLSDTRLLVFGDRDHRTRYRTIERKDGVSGRKKVRSEIGDTTLSRGHDAWLRTNQLLRQLEDDEALENLTVKERHRFYLSSQILKLSTSRLPNSHVPSVRI